MNPNPAPRNSAPRRIAVIGGGISGLGCAWLLGKRYEVTLFEQDSRLGGHSNTLDIEVGGNPLRVDTGFIVFNEATYPNLIALFEHLGVKSHVTEMSFAVSLDEGRLEYAGNNLASLFAQKRNLLRPRFWSMLRDTLRFYREAPGLADEAGHLTLEEFLDLYGYCRAFREDHLYPMAAAIWSTSGAEIGAQPAAAFIRFCQNHGLLQISNRPLWRTVAGGSRSYVEALRAASRVNLRTGEAVVSVRRTPRDVMIKAAGREDEHFDDVVLACHADQALALLKDTSPLERALLSPFRYQTNVAYLHGDIAQMPRRRAVWSSWNYLASTTQDTRQLTCTYWMNRLQALETDIPVLVTLNPASEPDKALTHAVIRYEHPQFDSATFEAQKVLWRLQGVNRTWFCGAYFGAGFHEDGLQAGLAVAEQLGSKQRPWQVADPNGRIVALAQPNAREAVQA